MPRCRKILSAAALTSFLGLVLCLALPPPAPVRAAVAAEEQTILYYLVEMQRQHVRACNGVPAGDNLRSLIPSEALRTLAGLTVSSARPLPSLLEAHGLADAEVFHATVPGDSPQQVFSRLLARDCAALMVPGYRYIGASGADGSWTVLMADREPVFGEPAPAVRRPAGALVPAPPQEGVVPLEDQPAPLADLVPAPEIPATPPSSVPRPSPSAASGSVVPDSRPATRQARVAGSSPGEDLLPLINEARARGHRCGDDLLSPAPPLVLNPVLAEVAQAQVQDMIRGGYFASTRPDGKSLGMRLAEAEYPWGDAAESIASVSPPASRAVAAWLKQENQCRILLSPAYSEAGSAFDGRRNYWVLTLAQPLPEGPDAVRLPAK